MILAFAILILVTLSNLGLGLLVLKKSPNRNIGFSYFLFAIGISGWAVTNAIFQVTNNHLFAFVDAIISYYAGILIALPFFYFTLVFPAGLSNIKKYHKPILLAWGFIWFLIITIPDITLKDVVLEELKRELITGWGLIFHFASIAALMAGGIINLIIKFRKANGILKLQIFYVLLGVIIMTFFGVIFNLVLPLFGNYSLVWLGPNFSIFLLASAAYSIVRYRLMDIEIVIRRGATFTLLFGAIAFVFTWGVSLLGRYLPDFITHLLVAFVVILIFSPLKEFLEKITDKIFFKKRYRLEDAISELNSILIRGSKLSYILSGLLFLLNKVLKIGRSAVVLAESGDFYVRAKFGDIGGDIILDRSSAIVRYFELRARNEVRHGEEILDESGLEAELLNQKLPESSRKEFEKILRELRRLGFALIAPFSLKGKLLGFLFLGKKLSGDPFSSQDLKFLDILAHETSFSIENALGVEKLLRLDEVKSEFIAVVSHQLRTPLSVIRWNFELLLEGAFGKIEAGMENIVKEMYQAMLTLNQGLNNLMVALEVEEEKIVMKYDDSDFETDAVDEVLRILQGEIEVKKISVKREISKLPKIKLDRTKIKKVLDILISNAVLYSPAGSEIKIKATFSPEENLILAAVEDKGIGIPPENKELIFQKFFRGETAKKNSPGGFGLGLFVAKAYVNLHGGKLWVGEKSGPGAVFYFTLPIAPSFKE